MSSPSRTVRGPRLALPKPVTVAAAVVVLPALMAVLAVALTMLTRMLVEREQEPALHWPTFWVWFVLCTGGIAVPMIVAEIRRDPDSRHPTPPAGSRLTLTVQEEEAGPVTRVALAVPGTPAVSTLVRAHELAAADVGLMEQLTSGTSGLGTSRGDTHELNAAGLALLASSTGTFRDILSELVWRARHEPLDEDGTGSEVDAADLAPPAADAQDRVDVFNDPHLAVPKGPGHRRVQLVTWTLIGLYAVAVVSLLVWRGVSDSGTGPDIDDYDWAMNVGGTTILLGPFVIWGAFGVQNYVRAREAQGGRRAVAARAWADFWFFGFCSALVMVFIGLVAAAGVWIGTDGFVPTLIALAVTGLFVAVARWCHQRRRAWSTIPR